MSASAAPKSREVRLGIVMYGGISLAIYIYGVAHELFRAVRGRGVYELVKVLTDSDIVVDVVSGTSAGGINGILLSYALCNERELGDAASLWRQHGDIRQMLRSPGTPPAECRSVLDSRGYYEPRLNEAFLSMGRITDAAEMPSELRELDLFVTGTDVDGRLFTQFDDAGHPIDVKDHRVVFWLKHRRGRKEPFRVEAGQGAPTSPGLTIQALSRLARITSCFPVAFEPVTVAHVEPGDGSIDAKLQLWGDLGKEACFLDGGLLDNKPFSYTTKAIFSRAADREVQRLLFYVEPDPESFTPRAEASNPNVVEAALAALIGIPGYESISEDLKLLADHNSRLEQYGRLLSGAQRHAVPGASVPPMTAHIYERSRMVFLSERVVQGVLRTRGRHDLVEPAQKAAATGLIAEFDQLMQQLSSGAARLLQDYDIYFYQRRLVRVIYLIYDRLHGPAPVKDVGLAEVYRAVWQAFNRQLKLYEILQASIEGLIDHAPIPWSGRPAGQVWGMAEAALKCLLDSGSAAARAIPRFDAALHAGPDWLPQGVLSDIDRELKKLARHIVEDVEQGRVSPSASFASLFSHTSRDEAEILTLIPGGDEVRLAYETFSQIDAELFPIEMISGLREKDIIKTIRISPRDAQRGFSDNAAHAKVSGDALYHFGGFFKRSWRSNDILWGRLDSICQLLDALVKPERLKALGDNDALRPVMRARLADVRAERVFPHSPAAAQERINRWLDDVFDDVPATRQSALAPDPFAGMLELLTEAAQLEELRAEVPNVIEDAITEQAAWNQFRVQEPAAGGGSPIAGYEAGTWSFRSLARRLDPFVTVTGAAVIAQRVVAEMDDPAQRPASPKSTGLGRFFRQKYRVGAESIGTDVPGLVLLETLVVALLVVRNCLLSIATERGRTLGTGARLAIAVFVSAPLGALHALSVTARTGPQRGMLVRWGLAVVCVLTLVAAWLWPETLAATWTRTAVFVGLPLVLLAASGILMWVMRRAARPRPLASP